MMGEATSKFKISSFFEGCKQVTQNQIWTYLKIKVGYGIKTIRDFKTAKSYNVYDVNKAYIFTDGSVVSSCLLH